MTIPFVLMVCFVFRFTGIPFVFEHAQRRDTCCNHGGDRLLPTTHATQGAADVMSCIANDLCFFLGTGILRDLFGRDHHLDGLLYTSIL